MNGIIIMAAVKVNCSKQSAGMFQRRVVRNLCGSFQGCDGGGIIVQAMVRPGLEIVAHVKKWGLAPSLRGACPHFFTRRRLGASPRFFTGGPDALTRLQRLGMVLRSQIAQGSKVMATWVISRRLTHPRGKRCQFTPIANNGDHGRQAPERIRMFSVVPQALLQQPASALGRAFPSPLPLSPAAGERGETERGLFVFLAPLPRCGGGGWGEGDVSACSRAQEPGRLQEQSRRSRRGPEEGNGGSLLALNKRQGQVNGLIGRNLVAEELFEHCPASQGSIIGRVNGVPCCQEGSGAFEVAKMVTEMGQPVDACDTPRRQLDQDFRRGQGSFSLSCFQLPA